MENFQINLSEARDGFELWSHIDDHVSHADLNFGDRKGDNRIYVFQLEYQDLTLIEHQVSLVQRHLQNIHRLGRPALRTHTVDQIARLRHQLEQKWQQDAFIDRFPEWLVVLEGAVELARLLAQVLLLVLLLEDFSGYRGRHFWVLTRVENGCDGAIVRWVDDDFKLDQELISLCPLRVPPHQLLDLFLGGFEVRVVPDFLGHARDDFVFVLLREFNEHRILISCVAILLLDIEI